MKGHSEPMPSLPFRLAILLAVGTALLTHAPIAHAQTVYDNGTPISGTSRASDTLVPQYLCDTFTFAAPTTFNTITWYGFYNPSAPPPADDFTLTLYTSTGGILDTLPFVTLTDRSRVTRTFTGQRLYQTIDLYQYTGTLLSPLTLNTGTYGLGIVNGAVSWFWPSSSDTGTYYVRGSTTQTWGTGAASGELAFRLGNTAASAPEPGSALLLTPLLPLAACARRRKSRP